MKEKEEQEAMPEAGPSRGGEGPCSCGAEEKLLTVPEVAAMLRLTRKGIYSLIEARRIPFIRVSNRVRFCQGDVLRYVSENRVPSVEKTR